MKETHSGHARDVDSPHPSAETPRRQAKWTPQVTAESFFGRVLGGRFVIRSLIARSMTSLVFLADDRQDGRPVAVKLLHTEDLVLRRHFDREARVLANLEHPHVIGVLATGTDEGGRPYLVLPYLGGDNLRARLSGGPLDWRVVLDIGAQIADSLHALHLVGVIHRDVKLDNIIWTRHPTWPVWVKLIDLGAAKLVGFEPPVIEGVVPLDMRPTSAGYVFGTRGYRPPEAEDGVCSARSDVFSLGVTLYELCAGVLPYPDLRPLAEVCPGWDGPPELEAALLKAIDLDPERRHATADEFRRELEAIRLVHPEDGHPRHLLQGRWDLIGVLGSGATATTYRAYSRELMAVAAIKVLDPKAQADPDVCLRFIREAIILRSVRHSNLPAFYELGTDAGRRYIVMELRAGKRAAEYASRKTCLPARTVICIGQQLASTLGALHEAGVIYRDLSTDNVLIHFDGPDPKVSLIDFNASLVIEERFFARLDERWAPPPEARPRPSRDLKLEGSRYAAPEVRAGAPWSEASDVFALGMLLYQLLTGHTPFHSFAPKGTPAAIRKDCPTNLVTALHSALELDPEKRGSITSVLWYLDLALDELAADAQAGTERRPDEHVVSPTPAPKNVPPPAASSGPLPVLQDTQPPAAASESPPVDSPMLPSGPIHAPEDSPPATGGALLAPEDSLSPAPVVIPAGPAPAPAGRRLHLLAVTVGAVLVAGLALLAHRVDDHAPPNGTEASALADRTERPAPRPPATSPPVAPPAIAEQAVEADMATVLSRAAGSLQACARTAGRSVTVELAAEAGASHFTSINILPADPALQHCIRDVLEPLRFAAPASTITSIKRYRP